MLQDKADIIGQRLYDLIDPWDREYAEPAKLSEDVRKNPEDVIIFLLDYIENERG